MIFCFGQGPEALSHWRCDRIVISSILYLAEPPGAWGYPVLRVGAVPPSLVTRCGTRSTDNGDDDTMVADVPVILMGDDGGCLAGLPPTNE